MCVCSKTVEVLALVLANPAPPAIVNGTAVKTKLGGQYVQSRGTLVICKVRCATQRLLSPLNGWYKPMQQVVQMMAPALTFDIALLRLRCASLVGKCCTKYQACLDINTRLTPGCECNVCVQVSLVGQWVTEARSKLADKSLKVCEYHGGNRPRKVSLLAEQDVVVTTYETLSSDMLGRTKSANVKGDPNPLTQIKWWRIVLDESHAVKGEASKQLKAVMAVQVRTVPVYSPLCVLPAPVATASARALRGSLQLLRLACTFVLRRAAAMNESLHASVVTANDGWLRAVGSTLGLHGHADQYCGH